MKTRDYFAAASHRPGSGQPPAWCCRTGWIGGRRRRRQTPRCGHRRMLRSSPPDRPQQSNHHCGEGRRQGSGSSVTRRRSPPSPRRSPPGRDRGNGRVARTPHATEAPVLFTNVVLHDGVAARETVLVPEAVEDALRSVPLLAVAGPIVFQDPIDDSRERTQRLAASAARFGDTLAAPRTTASYGPSCGLHQTPARPRGCSSPRHDTPAEPVRTTPPDTSPPPSSQSNPDRRLYTVPFWSAAAGSTGRFSGGLLLCRSQPGRRYSRRRGCRTNRASCGGRSRYRRATRCPPRARPGAAF